MSRTISPAFGFTALRRQAKPFAWLGAALLVLQLLVFGANAGAKAAGVTEILCTGGGEVPAGAAHEGEGHLPCESLAAGACGGTSAGPVPQGEALGGLHPPQGEPVLAPRGFVPPASKPLDLFARAGRGPPLLSS